MFKESGGEARDIWVVDDVLARFWGDLIRSTWKHV